MKKLLTKVRCPMDEGLVPAKRKGSLLGIVPHADPYAIHLKALFVVKFPEIMSLRIENEIHESIRSGGGRNRSGKLVSFMIKWN
jgi:hypothetical protein